MIDAAARTEAAMSDLRAALCVGLHALFESTELDDHREAAAICAACPAIAACRRIVPPGTQIPTGTWAGRLYTERAGHAGTPLVGRTCERCEGAYDARSSTGRHCDPCRAAIRAAAKRRYDRTERKRAA